jgi:hypothetical protein
MQGLVRYQTDLRMELNMYEKNDSIRNHQWKRTRRNKRVKYNNNSYQEHCRINLQPLVALQMQVQLLRPQTVKALELKKG